MRSACLRLLSISCYHKYLVDAVYDGKKALAYARAEHYDGIILDIMMPKMSGLEVLSTFSILLGNAAKYTDADGTIVLTLERTEKGVLF